MSRDTTAWSVKGIDQATRDIARRAAASSGMTIGEWIDHAIKSDSANRGVPVPLDPGDRGGGPGAAPRRRVDGISADTVEAIFSRISDGERLFEARLRPIGYALKDVAERVVALERGAEQLPPPGRQGIDVEPRQPEPPIRTPIPFRPIAQAPTQQSSDREPEDDIWSSDPPTPASEPRGDRPTPTPITFRPIASPEPELADKKEDFGSVSQSDEPQPTAPNGPPEAWKPEIDIDRAALSRAAADIGTTPEEPGYPEPVGPGMEPVQAADEAEIADAEPDEIPPAPAQRLDRARRPEIDDDPTTLRERPEAIPPTADFPADPIDTRSLGLSGEPIPTALPPRRLAGAGRLAIAASVVLALVAGAAWTIHREGVVSLGTIGDRLTQAENAVHIALVETTDWVVHLVATTEHAQEDTESPHGDPGTTAPSGTLASADPTHQPQTEPTSPPPGHDKPEAGSSDSPTPAPGSPAPGTEQTRVASAPAGAASTDTKVAPPLPEKAIDVDPRPVAPPPAPHLTRPPAQTSSAAAPSRQGAPPLSRAEAGNPAAQFEVAAGMMRAAVPRPEEAATWFREAAINGLDVAQFNLGVMYEMGLGVPEDETRALLWYHSAAEQGHPLAQYNLGRLYALGKGIPQSDAESKRWFQRAADRGVSAALYAMATFEPGELERERMMYTAAKAGAEEAQAWLREKSSGGTPPAPLGGPAGLVLDPPTGAPDIAAIQEGLAALGYYAGPIDGIAGPVTRAAIGKFQNDNGLPATGLPSRSLRQRLN